MFNEKLNEILNQIKREDKICYLIGYLNNSLNGVLITDISDHFPIFHINRICHVKELDVFMYKRIYNMNNKQAFMQELQ